MPACAPPLLPEALAMTAELERLADALEAQCYGAGPPTPIPQPPGPVAQRSDVAALVELVRSVVDRAALSDEGKPDE